MVLTQVNEHLQHHNQNHSSLCLDALYCEEERYEELEDGETETSLSSIDNKYPNDSKSSLLPLLLDHDLFWEDEELISLFTREKQTHCSFIDNTDAISVLLLSEARGAAVDWIMRVNSHHGFSALTTILAINYLDRFLSRLHYQQDKPWMIQLAAVTCLSLAAKVEENEVPLLLDLQVEDAKYVFEAKTIQRMELLVLSTLKWRMNPVTPLSFLGHIIRRLGLENDIHWEFVGRCETLLLSIIADARSVRYLPSIMATATMLHVIHQVEPCKAIDYQDQLLGLLKLSKENVSSCYELIVQLPKAYPQAQNNPHKRKSNQVPSSRSGVIGALFCSDSSNDSFKANTTSASLLHLSLYSRKPE